MRKGKRERYRLNMDFPCDLENGLKSDTFLADLTRTVLLCRFANGANSSDVAFRESILV